MIKRFAIILLLAGYGTAQLPDAPQPQKTSTRFWVLTGAYTAGIVGDDITTQRFERLGCIEVWSPVLYGRTPSNTRLLAVSFGFEAVEVIVARKMVRAKSPFWKTAGYGLLAGLTGGRVDGIVHNMRLTSSECR
jgi:hypothetical protein